MKYLQDAFNYLSSLDSRLELIIKALPHPQYSEPQLPYLGLMSSVASQQLSTKVAKVIWDRFLNLFEDQYPHPSIVREMDKEVLRSIGFSYAKAQYVINIGHYFHENDFDHQHLDSMSDEDLLKSLTSIKGVGEWTVQMLQIFTLHKEDIWPVKDLGVQQGFAKMLDIDPLSKDLTKMMNTFAEKWRPYRSAVALLLWKWKDSGCPDIENIHLIKEKKKVKSRK